MRSRKGKLIRKNGKIKTDIRWEAWTDGKIGKDGNDGRIRKDGMGGMKMYQIDVGWWLLIIGVLDLWAVSMLVDACKAIKLCVKGKDWRMPAYELCGKVFLTIFAIVAGFIVITR